MNSNDFGNTPHRPSTMAEIARKCGVSVITVSRVFNHPDKVKESTRSKVLAACAELGFNHNAFASNLVRAKPNPIVGFIASNVGDPLFQTITNTVQQAAVASDLDLLLGLTRFDVEREAQLLARYFQYRVTGVVVYNPTIALCRNPLLFKNPYCPVLMLWERPEAQDGDYIGVDPVLIGRLAAEHIVRLGHKDIALVTGDAGIYRAHCRRSGFMQVLREHGLAAPPEFLYNIPLGRLGITMATTMDAGYDAGISLLKLPKRPTAIILPSDDIAAGAAMAAKDLGLAVPRDLSIMSMTEIRIARTLDYQLSTVRIAYDDIRTPMQEFFRQIQHSAPGAGVKHNLNAQLVARDSTARLK